MTTKQKTLATIGILTLGLLGAALAYDVASALAPLNTTWTAPGGDELSSMPLGNGETALNVWTMANGDLEFYISRTDAWAENGSNGGGDYALVKLGKLKVQLSPAPGTATFSQVLNLHQGEILVTYQDGTTLLVWVDANNDVIHVEADCASAKTMTVAHDFTRTVNAADTILDRTADGEIMWYHRNPSGTASYIKDRTFGAVVKGPGLTSSNTTTLTSASGTSHRADIYTLTTRDVSAAQWEADLDSQVATIDAIGHATSYANHLTWWQNFWDRSYIFVSGDSDADIVTEGYVLSRFTLACQGRGAYPMKFNGGIFNVAGAIGWGGDQNLVFDSPDRRGWGGKYWWQNTRHMYWPLSLSGDYDMMMPLFDYYKHIIMENKSVVQSYWGHDGSIFYESWPLVPGLPDYMDDNDPAFWHGHTWTPILELGAMMWDYYIHTEDDVFAANYLVPILEEGFTFYDEHFDRDGGMLDINPANAAEQHWKVVNPVTDLAALHYLLPRMISLSDSLVSPADKIKWQALLAEIKPVPISNGKIIDYYGTLGDSEINKNSENPELYAVYPFKLYGLVPGNNEIAQDTFDVRSITMKGCWHQDPIQSALMGYASKAKELVTYNYNFQAPEMMFPAFHENFHDYSPDFDGTGNAQQGLQAMILQYDEDKIILHGAWPSEWNADFKLNAPKNTTVEGTIQNGQVINLVVTPVERMADVEILTSGFVGVNMAQGQPATQSSLNAGGVPERAVDGNTSGNWGDGSVTHTTTESQPWWQVDLGSMVQVGELKIYNRTDAEPQRLTDYNVEILDEGLSIVWSNHQTTQAGTPTVLDAEGATGRYVKVQLTGTGILSLAEVEVLSFEVPTVTGNLVANGSFETGDTSDWSISSPSEITVSTNTTSDGTYALKLVPDVDNYIPTSSQSVAVQANTEYTLTYDVLREAGSTGALVIRAIDDNSRHIDYNPTFGWESRQIVFNSGANTSINLSFWMDGGATGTSYLDNFVMTAPIELTGYDLWASTNGISGGPTDDDNLDGLDNLSEYAVGQKPTITKSGATFDYVHKQRTDDPNLSYEVQTCADLVIGSWTNTGYTVTGTNVTGGTYDSVTNSIPTTGPQSYIRLRIQND